MEATSSIDLAKFYPDDLVILAVEEKVDSVILYMQSKSTEFICPCCNSVSHVHHGTYHRRVQNLPLFQKTVWLYLNAYQHTCENPVCKVHSMVETFHNFLHFKKRMTERC
ncbi:transposase family protein [Propionispira raffinosivorans]|uniref:transposase family protein n=1 Tax=Propionispira raffinosivorans TaxID=86959 RepID=UPI000687105C|nr:transposase family protein [Propionispira raffinosivorans]